MQNMKKIAIILLTVCTAVSILSSCNKDVNIVSGNETNIQTYTLTLPASKAPSTKALVLEGGELKSVWGENDVVNVYKSSTLIGTLSPQTTGEAYAVLSGTLTGDINIGDWIDLEFKGNFASQDGSLDNVADWMKAWFQVGSIDNNRVIVPADGECSKDGIVTFRNWTSIVRFNLKKKSDNSNLSASKMVIKTTNRGLEGSSSNMLTVIPGGSASSMYVAIANLYEGTAASDDYEIFVNASDGIYSCKATGKTFAQSQFYDITLKLSTHAYRLAGEPASVFTKEWNTEESANDLTYDSASGLYKINYEDVPGGVESIAFKVLTDEQYPAGDNYVVSEFCNGYSRTFTVTYDPITVTTNHLLGQNTSPYKIYVKDEELAVATKWGSTRSIWCEYDFIELDDVDGYNCFSIPHAIVDGSAHDLYYKGENNCEVKLSISPSAETKDYLYKTNGFELVPSDGSYTSEKRVWVQTNREDVYAHMWENNNNSNSTAWGTCLMTTDDAKYDGRKWYYAPIASGRDRLILSWAGRGENDKQRVSYNISASQNYYYYVTYYSDSESWYGQLFTGGWE